MMNAAQRGYLRVRVRLWVEDEFDYSDEGYREHIIDTMTSVYASDPDYWVVQDFQHLYDIAFPTTVGLLQRES